MAFLNISGQSFISQGIITRCYTNGDCSGEVNEEFSEQFDSVGSNNYCCYDENVSPRPNPEMLSFTLNGGECKRCDGKAMHPQLIATVRVSIFNAV